MVSHMQQLLYTWTDCLVPIKLEAGWVGTRIGLDVSEKSLAPAGI
jgi:hypothetical protein